MKNNQRRKAKALYAELDRARESVTIVFWQRLKGRKRKGKAF